MKILVQDIITDVDTAINNFGSTVKEDFIAIKNKLIALYDKVENIPAPEPPKTDFTDVKVD